VIAVFMKSTVMISTVMISTVIARRSTP